MKPDEVYEGCYYESKDPFEENLTKLLRRYRKELFSVSRVQAKKDYFTILLQVPIKNVSQKYMEFTNVQRPRLKKSEFVTFDLIALDLFQMSGLSDLTIRELFSYGDHLLIL